VKLPDEDERTILIWEYLGEIPGCKAESIVFPMATYTDGWTGADFKKLGGKLEMQYFKQGSTPLDALTIVKIYTEMDRKRKRNFSLFEKEYKRYQKQI